MYSSPLQIILMFLPTRTDFVNLQRRRFQLVHGHIESESVAISGEDDKHVIVLQEAYSRTDIVSAMLDSVYDQVIVSSG